MSKNMHYVFTGFSDTNAIRRFAFDRVAEDRSRTTVRVDADMALAREHNILLQDLPLLCLRFLENADQTSIGEYFVFSEAKMAETRNAVRLAAEKKMAKRPRFSPNAGQAWRGERKFESTGPSVIPRSDTE